MTARETNSRQKRLCLIICLSAVSGGDDVFEDGGEIRGPCCGRKRWEKEKTKKENKTAKMRGQSQRREESEESERRM